MFLRSSVEFEGGCLCVFPLGCKSLFRVLSSFTQECFGDVACYSLLSNIALQLEETRPLNSSYLLVCNIK